MPKQLVKLGDVRGRLEHQREWRVRPEGEMPKVQLRGAGLHRKSRGGLLARRQVVGSRVPRLVAILRLLE